MPQKIYQSIIDTVGNTPLIQLHKVTKGIAARVLAKVEFFNPGGSVKDRIAMGIIDGAEKEGRLKLGGTIVEATSGNTGAGLALVAAIRGYKAIFTMPDKMSNEKIRLLKAYGADVVVCPTAVPPDSPESYYEVAKKLAREIPNAILANQYFNPKNPEAHYLTTGPELWDQTDGKIDYFVAGLGTGGTISGTSKFLKEKNPSVKIIGADPDGSILREYFYTKKMIPARPYKVEGVGEDILPGTLDFSVIDEVITANDKQSFQMARRLAREEGLFIGGSGGLAAHVALQVASKLPKGKTVVVLLPDTGERYLSKFYNDEWMRENRFLEIERVKIREILAAKPFDLPSLISVTPETVVRAAFELMEEKNVSQIPVLSNGETIGSLEEGALTGKLLDNQELLNATVEKVMDKPFPIIQEGDTIDRAKELFSKKNAAILVKDQGKFSGIITKSDIITFIAT
jgi:cystathionine beta-synthase